MKRIGVYYYHRGSLNAGIGDHWFNFGGVWTVRVEGSLGGDAI